MTENKNEHSKSGELKELDGALSFGSQLRAAREAAGFSIERVAMATRISQPFIEALESEQFHKLPGDMFGRGFLRNLCKAYGKPSEPLLAALELSLQTARGRVEAIHQAGRDEKRHQQLKKGVLSVQPKEWKMHLKTWAPHHYLQPKPLIAIAATLFLAIVLVNVWNRKPETYENSSVAVETRMPQPAAAEVLPPAPAAQAPANSAQAVAPAEVIDTVVTGKLEVELRVKEPVSVTLNKDQDKQTTEQLQVKTYRYPFDQQFKLYVENPAAVEIYFKGQRIGANAAKGEPKRFTFAASPSEIAKKEVAPKL